MKPSHVRKYENQVLPAFLSLVHTTALQTPDSPRVSPFMCITVSVSICICFEYLSKYWRENFSNNMRMIECVTQKDRQQLDGFKSLRKILNLESDGSNCWTFPLPWQVNSCQLASFCQLSSSCREHHLLHLFLFSKTHREGKRWGEMVDYKGQT